MANSDVIAAGETEILSALQYHDAGERRAYARDRLIRGTIVHDDERQALIPAFFERAEALNGMYPTVPVQDDAAYLWS